jgi:four helix bundle protein
MQDFRQLQVWQRAHQLNLALYGATGKFPKSELFGLTSQIRRAGISITANLAEGRGRGSDADFVRFVFMAMGSACELESHLELAKDLKLLPQEDFHNILAFLAEVKRMLAGLIAKLAPQRTTKADSRWLTADS